MQFFCILFVLEDTSTIVQEHWSKLNKAGVKGDWLIRDIFRQVLEISKSNEALRGKRGRANVTEGQGRPLALEQVWKAFLKKES